MFRPFRPTYEAVVYNAIPYKYSLPGSPQTLAVLPYLVRRPTARRWPTTVRAAGTPHVGPGVGSSSSRGNYAVNIGVGRRVRRLSGAGGRRGGPCRRDPCRGAGDGPPPHAAAMPTTTTASRLLLGVSHCYEPPPGCLQSWLHLLDVNTVYT